MRCGSEEESRESPEVPSICERWGYLTIISIVVWLIISVNSHGGEGTWWAWRSSGTADKRRRVKRWLGEMMSLNRLIHYIKKHINSK